MATESTPQASPWRDRLTRRMIREPDSRLERTLGIPSVLFLAVGAVIGTGIFVILGSAVPIGGPAVVLSFIVAGVACVLSGLAYAELASSLPSSGSVYSYAYATTGELLAWIVGWCLILEYGIGLAAIAVGWSEYFIIGLEQMLGIDIPQWLTSGLAAGGFINVPAVLLLIAGGWVVARGVSESARMTSIIVIAKFALLAFFVIVALTGFNADNLSPFFATGIAGMLAASSGLIFAYAGFDAAAVAGAEAKNPKRAIPVAILGGLGLVMVIYVIVSLAAVAAFPWNDFGGELAGEAVLASILDDVTGSLWAGDIMAVGAVITIVSAILAQLYTLSRVTFTISDDGLLPKRLSTVSPRSHTPVFATWLITFLVCFAAAFLPLDLLAESVSLGTLLAFVVVCIAMLVLRRQQPDLPRSFRVPFGPVIPVLAIIINLYLMSQIRGTTWQIFSVWLLIGLVLYFTYGARNSAAGRPESRTPAGLGEDIAEAIVDGLADSVDGPRHRPPDQDP